MPIQTYLLQTNLTSLQNKADELQLNSFVNQVFTQELPELNEDQKNKLLQYKTPKLGEGGSCSILSELENQPYNIDKTINEPNLIEKLWRLNQIIKLIQTKTKVDWIGIYKKATKQDGSKVLVKLAYYGEYSRAEFPLTKEFAQLSNNYTVGLSGKAKIVQSVEDYEGPYYNCDSKVNSEFCLPIINNQNQITGIIGAEAFGDNFFDDRKLLEIAKVASDLANYL